MLGTNKTEEFIDWANNKLLLLLLLFIDVQPHGLHFREKVEGNKNQKK